MLKMNITPVVFCILLNQVLGQTKDFSPAKILVRQRTVSESSDLYVTCSMFGQKKDHCNFVYLLKDGQGIQKMTQKQNLNDVNFKISSVHLDHSGNYSCLCSTQNYNLSAVAGQGQDVVEILVIANCIPAALSVAGPNTVNEGKHVEFKCTFSETLHTLNNCQLIYCCLMKNETFIQFQVFDVARMEASFTIADAVARDSGHYSCLLLPSKCFQNCLNELQGINYVFLEVKEYLIPWGALIYGFTVFLLLYSLCLCWIFNKKGLADTTSCKPCLNSEQLETDTVLDQTYAEPEEAEDPRMQMDRQHDEEEDSFSVESEEEIQNHVQTSMDDNYPLYNMIYSLPDESPARPRSTLVLHMTSPIKQ